MKDFFSNKVMPKINKFSNHHYIKAIQQGVMGIISVTIFSGIISILKTPPFAPTADGVFATAWRNFSAANAGWLEIVYQMSIGVMALLAIVGIIFSLCKHYDLQPLNYIIIGLTSTLILSVNIVPIDPENIAFGFLMDFSYLGAQGLFTSIVVGIFVVEMLRYMNKKNIKIKMPDSVPPMVSQPFEALIASGAVLSVVVIIRIILDAFGVLFPELITLALEPIMTGANSFWSIVLLIGLSRVLWFFGIHGTSIILAVLMPIMIVNGIENLDAYNAGVQPENIVTGSFIIFQLGMLPAAISMLLVSKSKQLKTVSKLGLVPSIFMISEPILFGTPFIFNAILFIPHILSFMISVGVTYIAMDIGLVGKTIFGIPQTMPGPIAAFASTLDWKAVVLWFVILAISVVLYLPFVKKYDMQLLKEEASSSSEAS